MITRSKAILKKKFVLYVMFAIVTSVINIVSYFIFYNFIYKNILIANIFAYTVSIVSSFSINKRLVFKSSNDKVATKFVAYVIMKVVALLIDSGVLYLLTTFTSMDNLIAKIIANCSTTLSNYFISNYIFKDDKGVKKNEKE